LTLTSSNPSPQSSPQRGEGRVRGIFIERILINSENK